MAMSDMSHQRVEPDPLARPPLADAGVGGSSGAVRETPVRFTAADGYELAGLWVVPDGPAPDAPRAAVLISSGTGFPKEYYRRFATYGAQQGAACFLYDYRGIGESAPADLAAMEMDYTDWGRWDLPAAIATLRAAYPDAPTAHIGHSVGGHFLGFASNQDELHRHAFVCVGSGYWAKHFWASRPMELLFWWSYGPAYLAWKGYIPGGGLWGGTALPRGVFTTWRRWCTQPRYFLDELEGRLKPHHFSAVRAPIRSFIYADDPIATSETARDLIAVYPNAPAEIVVRRAEEYGLRRIGHAGLFRRTNAPAWEEIWRWALDHSASEADTAPAEAQTRARQPSQSLASSSPPTEAGAGGAVTNP